MDRCIIVCPGIYYILFYRKRNALKLPITESPQYSTQTGNMYSDARMKMSAIIAAKYKDIVVTQKDGTYATALALICSITFLIPAHTFKSVNI